MEGLARKLISSIVMTTSISSLSMIITGTACYIISQIAHNEQIFRAGMYVGTGIGLVGGLAISYITYREPD